MIEVKKKKYNFSIWALTVVIVIAMIVFISLKSNQEVKAMETFNKPKEETKEVTKNNEMIRNLEKNENIVFTGDSITEIYPIDEIYSNHEIINTGVSGYKTYDVLDKLYELVYRYNPTKVILLIGTNDIAGDISEEQQKETVDNIKKIHKNIKKNRPNAKLYIESIYPVNRNMNKEMVYDRTNETIQKMNKEIEKYCNEENITYIDLYHDLTDETGNFDKNYTYDGLHPSVLGYAKITRLLTPYVYE